MTTRTWTTSADFDEGTLVNVNHDVPDQLQLDANAGVFGFMMVTLSALHQVARINVDTGAIVGIYRVAPETLVGNPGRAAFDSVGNFWITNRGITVGNVGSCVKIGVTVGGTRTNAAGTADPTGEYLAPPYDYNTCPDRTGDGLIRTSRGVGNVLAWPDTTDGGDGTAGDPATVTSAQDECILLYPRISTGPQTRHVSVDSANDVWVASYPDANPNRFFHLDGGSGATIVVEPVVCGGFTGLSDQTGILWSTGVGPQNQLRRYDPTVGGSGTCTFAGTNPSGLDLDSTGRVWLATATGLRVHNPAGTFVTTYPVAGAGNLLGLTIAADDTVWVSDVSAAKLFRVSATGTLEATIDTNGQPNGVSIDRNGRPWVVSQLGNSVQRINPASDTIDMVVTLPSGSSPFCLGRFATSVSW